MRSRIFALVLLGLVIYVKFFQTSVTKDQKLVMSSSDCGQHNFFNELYVCLTSEPVTSFDGVAEPDDVVGISGCQYDCEWHLNYITANATIPTRGMYAFSPKQPETRIYIVDTLIDLAHPEFGGRAYLGISLVGAKVNNPHGTHVAGLAGGNTFGINRNAKLISVAVLGSDGRAPWSTIIAGLQWVSTQPLGVINLSIAGGGSNIIDSVVDLMVRKGYRVVAAAGNSKSDACLFSPARVPTVVTVGAYDKRFYQSDFSNYGECVNVSAPGTTVLSAYPDKRLAFMSGTSMAAPLVSGVWSLTLESSASKFLEQRSTLTEAYWLAQPRHLFTNEQKWCPSILE